MRSGSRTATIGVAIAVAVLAAFPAASSAAGLGDLLGPLLGGESQQPEQPPPPRPVAPPTSTTSPSGPDPVRALPKSDPLLAPASSCPGESDPGLPARAQERAMVCMLNFARVANGRHALRAHRSLHRSAVLKAEDISRCRRFSHRACGRNTWYWLARTGFFRRATEVGEILAYGRGEPGTVRGTMRRWLASKGHRVVLMSRAFDLVGVGTVSGRFLGYRGESVWVAHLGSLRHRG